VPEALRGLGRSCFLADVPVVRTSHSRLKRPCAGTREEFYVVSKRTAGYGPSTSINYCQSVKRMLPSATFMRALIDNATAIQHPTTGGPSKRNVIGQVTSDEPIRIGVPSDQRESRDLPFAPTLLDGHTTLGDGHTMPSKNAATPSASTKVEKLMDTLFRASSAPLHVTSRCNVLLRAGRSCVESASQLRDVCLTTGLFSTRVPRKESHKSNSINKSAGRSRHAFSRFERAH
jgi:hypothetical protein